MMKTYFLTIELKLNVLEGQSPLAWIMQSIDEQLIDNEQALVLTFEEENAE